MVPCRAPVTATLKATPMNFGGRMRTIRLARSGSPVQNGPLWTPMEILDAIYSFFKAVDAGGME